ncbi:hypothetical protein L6452_45066 [Arctium lappa]|nr:hypothetical protein L6452_45066 [Arctium lappa]
MPMVEIRVGTLVGIRERPLILVRSMSSCPSPASDETSQRRGDAGRGGKLVDPCLKHLGCPSPASDHTCLGHGDADKRSTRALPVAAMIHDNSTDRTALRAGDASFKFLPYQLSMVCDALRCSGPHARYTDVFNEYIALADRPGKSLKFHRDGDRSLQLLVLNEEFLVSASHQLALTTCARSQFGPRARLPGRHASRRPPTTASPVGCVSFGARLVLPCPWCGWPKKESPLTDARLVVVVKAFVSSRADAREALSNDPNVSSCNDASTATPADGGRRCVRSDVERREPVRQSTRGRRGPVRIGAAAKARAVDMPVEMPSRRSWLAARAVTACLGTCVLPAPACGHPIRPRLEYTDQGVLTCVGRRGCFVEPCHGIESSKWAIFGKQNWRCGMNRKPGYGAKLRANLEPTKGVGRLRQQDGGHGSRNPLRSV